MDSQKPRARIEAAPALPHPYAGLTAGFTTRHDKAALVVPHFESLLDVSLVTVDFDTDSLGTFSGEVPRKGSALDMALTKARVGAEFSVDSLGIGSEGTIGPSHQLPLLMANAEVLAFVDLKRGVSVSEHTISHSIRTISLTVEPHAEYRSTLAAGGFPDHGVIVKPADGETTPIFKGLHTFAEVDSAVRVCAVASADGKARIESDFRANHCPSRRPTISEAGHRLAFRLRSCCPNCLAPGWGLVSHVRGVPCSLCGENVDVPAREILGCTACGEQQIAATPIRVSIDPSRCPLCNP